MDKLFAISEISSRLHDLWREPRRLSEGIDKFEPRWKDTSDDIWITCHGTSRVDIANTAFADLPQDWQKENLASAEVAFDQIKKAQELGLNLDDVFLETASAVIHEEWLKRNGKDATPEQKLSYFQLPDHEKDKDRVIVIAALALLT